MGGNKVKYQTRFIGHLTPGESTFDIVQNKVI